MLIFVSPSFIIPVIFWDTKINKIVSFEYAKNFLDNEDDKTMCISAKKVLSGVNKSEIKIREINQSKNTIFDRIFNFFD